MCLVLLITGAGSGTWSTYSSWHLSVQSLTSYNSHSGASSTSQTTPISLFFSVFIKFNNINLKRAEGFNENEKLWKN